MSGTRLRVLFVGHTYVVGVNQHKLEALAGTGLVDIGLLVPTGWRSREWRTRFLLETPSPHLCVYSARVLFEGRPGAYLYPLSAITHAVHDFRPDIIQVEQEAFSLVAFEIACLSRVLRKSLTLFCWENTDRRISLIRRWTRKFVLRTVLLALPGNREAADLLRQWGCTAPIEVIPQLGVDAGLFRSPADRTPNLRPVVAYAGRLVPEKGVAILLQAVRILRDRGTECDLIVIGTGPEELRLRQLAQHLGLAESIIWRGAVSHARMPEALREVDIFVLPSLTVPGWKEQFGHVLIEAMAMGIPAIGSSCGEIPHVIGRSDLVFPEGDSVALAGILAQLIHRQDWRRDIGRYCHDRVLENYTHERIAARLIECWARVLTSPPRRDEVTPHENNQRAVI